MNILKKNTEERRLKLLTHEGLGLSKPEIVKILVQNFGVSRQTIYKDYNSKPQWLNSLLEMRGQAEKNLNRHEQIYRKAVYLYTTAASMKNKLAALNLVRITNKDMFEMTHPQGYDYQQIILEKQRIEVLNFDKLDAEAFSAAVDNFLEFELRKILSTQPDLYNALITALKNDRYQ